MNILKKLYAVSFLFLVACSPVKLPVTNQYQLTAYSHVKKALKHKASTLLVTAPEAVSSFATSNMLYVKKPYQLETFAHNAWVSPPAEMIYPLLVQSLQASNYFAAVSTSSFTQKADYRLDTQLLNLEQDFLQKPSHIKFSIKAVLTRVSDSKVLASKIISKSAACPSENPYGGVVAANQVVSWMTNELVSFTVFNIKK